MEKTIKVEGMMCPHCESAVKNALEEIDGVVSAQASHKNKDVHIILNKDVPTDVIKKAIEDEGYEVIG